MLNMLEHVCVMAVFQSTRLFLFRRLVLILHIQYDLVIFMCVRHDERVFSVDRYVDT